MRRPQPDQHSVETVFGGLVDLLPDDIHARVVVLPRRSDGWLNRWRNLVFTARLRADVIHVTGDVTYCAMAIRRSSCALTILDLVSISRLRGWRRRVLVLLWYRLPVWCASRVTTISPSVQRELVALLPNCASKTEVIGCSSVIRPYPLERDMRVPNTRIVLQVGTGPNKNLGLVAAALSGVGVKLRIIGRLSADQVRQLDELDLTYSADHDLSREQVIAEYRRADVLAFVSTYEGFGMPIIEAQSLGLPVVTSDIDPMRWVAGDGAVRIDPRDPDAVRTSVSAILESASLRDRLVRAGYSNAQRFAPARMADQYAALYRSLAKLGKR